MADEARNFIAQAQQLASENNFEEAFERYICAFDKEPRIKKRFQSEFRTVLSLMNQELAQARNIADIFANLERAIQLFPKSVELLNDMGTYFFRYFYIAEALCHFEKGLQIDPNFVILEKKLNQVKKYVIGSSEFRCINDTILNDAYKRAIRSCVIPAVDSVLDLDAGTGLLALYAKECNPIAITACESITTMARVAECVMQDNNVHAVVINKPSVELTHDDICGKPSVLLTNLFDSGLFGGDTLQAISNAQENLLCANSKIIPGRAEYFVAGISCDGLNKRYKLCRETQEMLHVAHMNVHIAGAYGQTYCDVDINTYGNVKYISEPQSLFKIDFNDRDDICEKLEREEPYIVKFNPKEDGEINSVIGWFNLYLTDDIMVTSDPRSEERVTAWQQAVFFDISSKVLRKNDTANVSFSTYGGKLNTLPEPNTTISRISSDMMAFLNDVQYLDMIRKSIPTVCVHLGQFVDISEVDMVDLSPFPFFGVLMMKRGAKSLICHVNSYYDKAFLSDVLAANEIPEDEVSILLPGSLTYNVFEGKKFHVIFRNFIEYRGDMDIKNQTIVEQLKDEHLISGGLCLPVSVTIMAQLINSKWLDINYRVLDENVGYKIAKHVKRYQMSQAQCLDMSRMEFQTLSDRFAVSCSIDYLSEVIDVIVTKDGECNGILCFYYVQLLDDWTSMDTCRANSFVSSSAYMVSPNAKVFCGDQVNVLKCIDAAKAFKLVLDLEP